MDLGIISICFHNWEYIRHNDTYIWRRCTKCGCDKLKKINDIRKKIKNAENHTIVYICEKCMYMVVTEWMKK